MTIETEINRVDHTGNGVTTVFAYNFLVYEEEHMTVFFDGVDQPTGWTIDGLGDPLGGNVTFSVAPADGVLITLLRDVPAVQKTDYSEFDGFPAETHERELDLGAMRDQQQEEVDNRTFKYDVNTGVAADDTVFPEPEPNKAIGYDANGKPANVVIGTGGSPVVNPLQEDLLSDGFAFVARDGVGGLVVAKMGADGTVEATEFTRQGQNLDLRYADRAVALAHYADGNIHFPDTVESEPQVRVAGGWLPLPESATVTVSDTPPSTPVNGDLWLQSSTGRLASYYDDGSSQQWVEVGPGAVGADPREVLLFDVDLAGLSEYAWELEAGYDYRYDISEFTFAVETWGAFQVSKDALPSPSWQGSDWTWVYDGGLGSGGANNATANAPLNISGVNIGTNTNERAYCWGHIRNADNTAAYRTFVNHKTRARLQNGGTPGSLQALEWSAWNQIAGPHVAARVSPTIATTFAQGRIRIWRERRGI